MHVISENLKTLPIIISGDDRLVIIGGGGDDVSPRKQTRARLGFGRLCTLSLIVRRMHREAMSISRMTVVGAGRVRLFPKYGVLRAMTRSPLLRLMRLGRLVLCLWEAVMWTKSLFSILRAYITPLMAVLPGTGLSALPVLLATYLVNRSPRLMRFALFQAPMTLVRVLQQTRIGRSVICFLMVR